MCHLRQFPEELSLSKVKRRLFDTKFNTQSGAGRRVKEIRIDAETLSERVQERDLFRLVTIWRIKETSAHDTGTGRGKI